MNTVTQTMQFRQSLLNYAEKGGVNRAAIKYNMNRNDIHSLANRLYRPIIRTSAQKRSFNGSQTFVGETQTQSWSSLDEVYRSGYKHFITGLYHVLRCQG